MDAIDLVVVRAPSAVPDAVVRRLAARARSKDAVLLPYLRGGARWPGADVTLSAETVGWVGIDGPGHGRLRSREMTISASGRGRHAPPRSLTCRLPASLGTGIRAVSSIGQASVTRIA